LTWIGQKQKDYITFCPKGVTEGSIILDIFFKLGKIDSFLLNLAQTERTSEITAEEIGQKRFIFLESYPNHLHQQPSREKLQPQPHPQEEVANSTVSLKRKVTSSAASHQEKFTTPPHFYIKFSPPKSYQNV
jgi:hypothetical protein